MKLFSKEILLLLISILLFSTAMGMDFVTFPAVLTKNGIDPGRIGIALSSDILSGIIMSFFLSKIVARFGAFFIFAFSSILYATAICLIYFYQNFYLWLGFCFLMGSCWFMSIIIKTSWLNSLTANKNRSLILGIFSMMISMGIFLGPVIVDFCGALNYLSFLISAALVTMAFATLLPIRNTIKIKISSHRIPLKTFFKKNPRCFLARLVLDFTSYSLLLFSVIFGNKIGMTQEKSGLLISAYMASGFSDVLVGFLLKKYNVYKMINFGFIGCLSCFLIVIFHHNNYLFLLTLYFIFGFFIACIFVSVFTIVNQDYPKEKLVAANSTFQLIGSIGSLLAGLSGGYLINIFGKLGLPFAIIFSCIFYLTFLVIYERKKYKT